MKLRNKKTGEIGGLLVGAIFTVLVDGEVRAEYATLEELNKEWEDSPEGIGCFITHIGGVMGLNPIKTSKKELESIKEIGNHFSTYEEAKKAVEKLKAWKRLKDKGFKFDGWGRYHWTGEECPHTTFSYPNFGDLFNDSETVADLDLLFGGEE